VSGGFVASVIAAGALLAVAGQHGGAAGAASGKAAAAAIAYARAQFGCPYVYGGTGPCTSGFDCSGLVQAAWGHAGVTIPRTSEEQWADLPHVDGAQLAPGDLIFYTGSPIDPPPGHVTLYAGGGLMIEAYGTGYPIREVPVRPGMTGFADPAGST